VSDLLLIPLPSTLVEVFREDFKDPDGFRVLSMDGNATVQGIHDYCQRHSIGTRFEAYMLLGWETARAIYANDKSNAGGN
jgi:hypothetical protein